MLLRFSWLSVRLHFMEKAAWRNSSFYFPRKKSNESQMTWGWLNDRNILFWVNYLFNDPWAIHSVDYVISPEIDHHEYIVTIGNITQP